jgi:hypothetical protein
MNRILQILAASCIALGAAVDPGSANEPLVDYTSILNMRIYAIGGAMFETVDVVFAPAEPVEASVEVQRDDGTALARFDFFPEYRFRDKAFGRLQASGPALWQADAAGDYQFVFRIGTEVVTRFPFSVVAEGGDDPFDAEPRYRFDGPWRELGYLLRRTYGDAELLDLVTWLGGPDAADGAGNDRAIARLLRDGNLVGQSRESAGHIPQGHFQQTTFAFFAPHEPRRAHEAPPIALGDLVDGDYEIHVQRLADGRSLRRFEFAVRGGTPQPDPRGTLQHQPRELLLSPRVHRKGGHYEFIEATWLTARH